MLPVNVVDYRLSLIRFSYYRYIIDYVIFNQKPLKFGATQATTAGG